MTTNEIFKLTKTQLVDETTNKSELLEQIELTKKRKNIAFEQIEYDLKNLNWTLIKNYRNVGGTLMHLSAVGPLIDLYKDIIDLDLRMLLLNALIQSQTKPIQDIIDSPEFINPYNGEKPYLDENKICLRVTDDPVCITIAPKTE